jgi:4-alpha-glucanotransferase
MAWDTTTRRAGLLVPVFSLRHAHDLGIGDTTSVLDALRFCHAQGLKVLQLLPINETGADHSPYNAISSVALDPALLSMTPETVPGLTEEILQRIADPETLSALRSGAVDYDEVKGLKSSLLSEAFAGFEESDLDQETPLGLAFQAFTEAHGDWLPGYSMYRTLLNEYEGNALWHTWAPEHQSLEEAETWLENSLRRDDLDRYRVFFTWIQWVAYRQWLDVRTQADALGIELMGDIPFGVSRYSADVWAERPLFDLTWSGGAPPEPFFKEDKFTSTWGQNWGIPLYDWAAHRTQDFAWWKRRVARTCDVFHAFRVDHVLGFFRVYSFPWTPERNAEFLELTPEEAAERCYGRVPQFLPRPDEPEESGELNCLEGALLLKVLQAAAPNSGIVAEDLGMVPDYVRPALTRLGIPGFTIPMWTRVEETKEYIPLDELPELSLCTYATHDHEPLRVMYDKMVEAWTGPNGQEGWLEMQRLMRFLGWEENSAPTSFTSEIHAALLKRSLESPCFLSVVMITDLLGTTQRFNLPGTSSNANWSERLEAPLTTLASDPRYGSILSEFRQACHQTGR